MNLRRLTYENFNEEYPLITRCFLQAQSEVADQIVKPAEIIFTTEECINVTRQAVRFLLENGIKGEIDSRNDNHGFRHDYVRFPGSGSGNQEIIGDGTWGQFIPPEKIYLGEPRMLIGPRNDVIQQALRYGVPDEKNITNVWQNR